MRFLHTADWQIGAKAQPTGSVAERVRQERIAAAERAVAAAREQKVEFILVAGDVFEDNGVERRLVQRVGDILAAFGGPVFLIPGNHDPAVRGSVWEHPVWKQAETLHVLLERKPVKLSSGLLYPCPLFEKHSSADPTAWIEPGDTGQIRIGVAHGTVEGIMQDEPDYPIARKAPRRSGLDYLALGHWHSTAIYSDASGAQRMAYSGTHETTRFGERDSGNVLVVDIASPHSAPEIEQVRTGSLRWEIMDESLRAAGDLTNVRKHIESLDDAEKTLLDVRLSGLLFASEREELSRIDEILHSRFLFGRLDSSALVPSPEDESWIAALPPGIIRDTATRLRELATSPAAAAACGTSQPVAARALIELYAIAEASRK